MKTITSVPLDAEIKTTVSSSFAARATKQLFLDENTADFHFVFSSNDDEKPMKLPVHKIILAAASPVFHTMFYGSLKEETKVEIVDASFEAFKEFLQYFYLDDVTLTMQHVPGVMYLAEKYEVNECLDACSTFLMQHLTADTVCWAYELAVLFKRFDLIQFCNTIVKSQTSTVLQSKCFMECDQMVLRRILKLDPLSGPKIDMFRACIAWAKASCQQKGLDGEQPQNIRAQLSEAFYEMPFDTLTKENFFDIVSPNVNLFTKEEFAELIQMTGCTEYKPSMFVKKSSSNGPCQTKEITNSSRIIENSFVVKNIETTTFSSNKPFLLKAFSLANVYDLRQKEWRFFVANFPFSKMTITKNGHEEHPQKDKHTENLFSGEVQLRTNGINNFELPNPILIKPGLKYEICLQQEAPPSSYTFNTLKSVLRSHPGIEIRFHSDAKLSYDNTATGLVTGLSIQLL